MNSANLFDIDTVTGVLSRCNSNRIEIERGGAKIELVKKTFSVGDIVLLLDHGKYVHIKQNKDLPIMVYHITGLSQNFITLEERNIDKTHEITVTRDKQLIVADSMDIIEYDSYKPDPVEKNEKIIQKALEFCTPLFKDSESVALFAKALHRAVRGDE